MSKKAKPGRKPGRPKVVFTDEQIKEFGELAHTGCQDGTIAAITGVDVTTLKARCSGLLHKKRAERKRDLRMAQNREASKGSVAMLIWLGKNGLGQADRQDTSIKLDETLCEIIAKRIKASK